MQYFISMSKQNKNKPGKLNKLGKPKSKQGLLGKPSPYNPLAPESGSTAGGGLPAYVWFGLLALPIVLGIGSGLLASDEPAQQQEQVQEQTVAPQDPAQIAGAACEAMQDMSGVAMSEPLAARLRDMPVPVRILPPNSMRTMDHNPQRINIDIDENNVITRVWCG